MLKTIIHSPLSNGQPNPCGIILQRNLRTSANLKAQFQNTWLGRPRRSMVFSLGIIYWIRKGTENVSVLEHKCKTNTLQSFCNKNEFLFELLFIYILAILIFFWISWKHRNAFVLVSISILIVTLSGIFRPKFPSEWLSSVENYWTLPASQNHRPKNWRKNILNVVRRGEYWKSDTFDMFIATERGFATLEISICWFNFFIIQAKGGGRPAKKTTIFHQYAFLFFYNQQKNEEEIPASQLVLCWNRILWRIVRQPSTIPK